MHSSLHTTRDMIGYGRTVPQADWPGGARVAVQIVLNYEEGAENCLLHGDAASEAFLSEIVGAQPWTGMRHMNMESLYEYGSRAGFWRLWRLFTERRVPVTVFGVATALARNPEVVAAMHEAEWEIASHGLKWIDHRDMARDLEAAQMDAAIRLHTEVTGSAPLGWYTGRSSVNTLELGLERGFAYLSDAYADDCPTGCMAEPVPGSSSPTRSMPTTCASPPRRASTRASTSSPICATPSTLSTRRVPTPRR